MTSDMVRISNLEPFKGPSWNIVLTLFALLPAVSGHTLAAEGAPLSMAVSAASAGRVAHVDTAAVGGLAAR